MILNSGKRVKENNANPLLFKTNRSVDRVGSNKYNIDIRDTQSGEW